MKWMSHIKTLSMKYAHFQSIFIITFSPLMKYNCINTRICYDCIICVKLITLSNKQCLFFFASYFPKMDIGFYGYFAIFFRLIIETKEKACLLSSFGLLNILLLAKYVKQLFSTQKWLSRPKKRTST